jgi:hypothetical protein
MAAMMSRSLNLFIAAAIVALIDCGCNDSMCANQYTARWPRVYRPTDLRYHCPNLYPTEAEKLKLFELGLEPIVNGTEILDETEGAQLGDVFVDKDGFNDGDKTHALSPDSFTANEPNTILSDDELQLHHFPVSISYSNFTQHHYSLVHLWNEVLQNYHKQKDFPHIIVRFEDLLYFPDQVVKEVCDCAEGRLYNRNNSTGEALPVKLPSQSQKQQHGIRNGKMQYTGYLDALIRYAQPSTRNRGMTPHDLQYAQRYLDKDLMELLGYTFPLPAEETRTSV